MFNRKNLLTFVVFALLKIVVNEGASNEGLIDHSSNSSAHLKPMNFENNNLLFLAELPLEQLLKVKKSIEEIQRVSEPESTSSNGIVTETTLESRTLDNGLNLPMPNNGDSASKSDALPLLNHNNPHLTQPLINRKTGYGGGSTGLEGPWETKPSKIQTFFQISVTALAFLAFAGYLLCMIVQAIKSKGTTFLMPNTASIQNASTSNTMNSLINTGGVPLRRRRRPIAVNGKRRRRNVLLSSDNRNDTISSLYMESLMDPYDGDMYNAMISIAEGYVKLHYFE